VMLELLLPQLLAAARHQDGHDDDGDDDGS
jgi:hypothetical protein